MQMIKGEAVQLKIRVYSGVDSFNRPVYSDGYATIENVLVGEATSDEVVSEYSISGKHISYMLGIPKGDEHTWHDTEVVIRGDKFRTIGLPVKMTAGNMPNWWAWDQKIKVERYE